MDHPVDPETCIICQKTQLNTTPHVPIMAGQKATDVGNIPQDTSVFERLEKADPFKLLIHYKVIYLLLPAHRFYIGG